ncbi:hypothetical protein PV326_008668 [Microctonus aethiopoides]|nr:hypothetical protein PV326_008668 [Microctonus aethiopoides]
MAAAARVLDGYMPIRVRNKQLYSGILKEKIFLTADNNRGDSDCKTIDDDEISAKITSDVSQLTEIIIVYESAISAYAGSQEVVEKKESLTSKVK